MRTLVFVAMLIAAAVLPAQEHGAPAAGAKETSPETIAAARRAGRRLLLIDVRESSEFAAGHAEDAINVPLSRLLQRVKQLQIPKKTELVTMCASGGRSSRAALELEKMGYKTVSYCPLNKWKASGMKIEKGR